MAANAERPRGETTLELLGDRELRITRTFRAPPDLVYEAWTQPELVRRWWAPRSRGVELSECTAEVRVGGRYRYVLRRGPESYGFSGEYLELLAPSRLVYTQIFDPFPDQPALITVTFEPRGAHTFMSSHERYPSAEAREGAIASGMEEGMRETMEQLDVLVQERAGRPS